MAFTPQQQKEYRAKAIERGLCSRCRGPMVDGAQTGTTCILCITDLTFNKSLWRDTQRIDGRRVT